MVGMFYRAPQPGADPFVEVGDTVAIGQTLCILEAMKLMNEVKAELEAVVRGIHVENAQPVEYGQLLFELEPLDARPLDAAVGLRGRVRADSHREPGRDRGSRHPRLLRARDRDGRRSSRLPTATRSTYDSPTAQCASARRRRPRAT